MIRIITLSMGLLAAVPVAGFAQDAPAPGRAGSFDARWTPYLGCWRLNQESFRASNVPFSDVMMVCVAPSASGPGVTMTTYAAGRSILTQTIAGDGQSYQVNEADCQGTQANEWSHDGERLFTRAELSCNARPKRNVTGITMMTKGPTWVDVQATDVDGTSQVRIRHYHRVNERPANVPELPDSVAARAFADAQALSAATMSLEDVIEASKKVSSPALEAALDESRTRFNLNSRTLTQLAKAGVSPDVIDLMIAQTFPDRFTIERASSGGPPVPTSIGAGGTTIIYGGFPGSIGSMGSMGYPYYDPYYSYYSYYSPFAYPYWGSNYYYNNYNYRGYPNTVIVPGSIGGGGGGTAIGSADSPGMVVNGRGYTRVTPGSSNTTSSSSGDDATAVQHTVTSPRGVRSTGSDSSSGGSVSSSGYSSGSSNSGSSSGTSSGTSSGASSSGDSGGRTAQPR